MPHPKELLSAHASSGALLQLLQVGSIALVQCPDKGLVKACLTKVCQGLGGAQATVNIIYEDANTEVG